MSETPLVKRSTNVIILALNIPVADEALRQYNLNVTSPGVICLIPGMLAPAMSADTPWSVVGEFPDYTLRSDMLYLFGPPKTLNQALQMENVETAINPRKPIGEIP